MYSRLFYLSVEQQEVKGLMIAPKVKWIGPEVINESLLPVMKFGSLPEIIELSIHHPIKSHFSHIEKFFIFGLKIFFQFWFQTGWQFRMLSSLPIAQTFQFWITLKQIIGRYFGQNLMEMHRKYFFLNLMIRVIPDIGFFSSVTMIISERFYVDNEKLTS